MIPTPSFAQTTAWVHPFGTAEYEEGFPGEMKTTHSDVLVARIDLA